MISQADWAGVRTTSHIFAIYSAERSSGSIEVGGSVSRYEADISVETASWEKYKLARLSII